MGDQGMAEKLLNEDTKGNLQAETNAPSPHKQKLMYGLKMCGGGTMACFVIFFILTWLLQGILYLFATTLYGCRAGALEDYDYKGQGGAEASANHSAKFNVMPQSTYLQENEHAAYGQSFAVLPYGGDAGSAHEAPVGTWWLAWGPVFNTYVYIDTYGSNTLLYMRRSMLRIGQSHRIGRCDSSRDMIEVEEGMNWFSNTIRSWLGMQQTMTMKVFWDKNDGRGRLQVATIEETNSHSSVPSITIHGKGVKWADSSLQNAGTSKQKWYVKNEPENELPFYVLSATTLLYAFHLKGESRAEPRAMEMPEIHFVNSAGPVGMSPQPPRHV